MIDARLMINAATKAGTRDAHQRVPTARISHNQRSARVTETSVLVAVRMARTEHLVEQFDVDLLALMPFDAVIGAWQMDMSKRFVQYIQNMLLSLIIGTAALCNKLVPVCPMFACVLPQPAITPFRPTISRRLDGRHIGNM